MWPPYMMPNVKAVAAVAHVAADDDGGDCYYAWA